MKTLSAVALALVAMFPAIAPAETCIAVGSVKAPVDMQIFDETQQGAEGKVLYSGRMNRDQRIPLTVSYLKFRYQYRASPGDSWSSITSEWCQRGEIRAVP